MSATPAAAAAAAVEWLDEVGYSANVAQRADVLKIAVQDPRHLWPHLQSTFASYQPFQGLQVRNKTGALQKVEDLYAEIVYMYMREPAGASATTNNSTRTRSSGLFGFGGGGGSGLSSTAPSRETSGSSSSSSSNLFVSTAQSDLSIPIGASEPASPVGHASSLAASLPSLSHPMRWHSYPYLHVLLVSPSTVDEYARTTKHQIKRFLDYFTSPQAAAGGSGASTPSSASGMGGGMMGGGGPGGGGSGTGFRASTPSAAGMVVAGSSLVPELRYHSEVLILYLPLLEGENGSAGAPLTPSGSFNSTQTSNSNSSSSSSGGGGGLSSLFKRSTSFSMNASSVAAAEERVQALKQARKVFERMKTDFGSASGGSRDAQNSQVARIDLYELLRLQEREAAAAAAASAAANSTAASGGVANAAAATTGAPTAASVTLTPSMIAAESPELVHQLDDFIARIVRSLIRTHETRATLYELELRKALANSKMGGWNFCAFFVLKESYALLHEQMGLRSDALRLYDELRANMDELLQKGGAPGAGGEGGEKRGLRYLLLSPRSMVPTRARSGGTSSSSSGASDPTTAVAEDPDADPELAQSAPMPAPILDVFSRNYPLLILRGELTELEFLRYLTAQSMWILFKISKTAASSAGATPAAAGAGSGAASSATGSSSASGGGGSASSSSSSSAASNPHPLCEIMRRGQDLIQTLLSLISSDPVRFPIAGAVQLAWVLEAAMDLGVLCEKYLVGGYVHAYQSLTARVLAAQAAQAVQQQLQGTRDAREKEKSSSGTVGGNAFSNVLASAMAAVIGPATAPATSSPVPAPATPAASTGSTGASSSSSSSSSLSLQTRALKAAHETDLRSLQHLRGDLYGMVLDRMFQWARAHPTLHFQGDIRNVMEFEARTRSQARASGAAPNVAPGTTGNSAVNDPNGDASGASSDVAPRIGLDDDVYTDMSECYYNPHELDARHTPALPRLTASGNPMPGTSAPVNVAESASGRKAQYALFEARHKRIMACFSAASRPPSSSSSSSGSSPSFTALFLELCTACLKMYWLSSRYRLCTRVAEVKACVYYSSSDYARALDLFLTNCDRWRKDKWVQLWYPSMLMAIKAQQRLGRHADVVRSCMLYLVTHHQHTSSARFRPPPKSGSEEPFSWSRIGGVVAAARRLKQNEQGSGGAASHRRVRSRSRSPARREEEEEQTVFAPAPKSAPGAIVSPLIPYTFPMLTPSSTTSSSSSSSSPSAPSSTGPNAPPVVQVVLVQSEDASTQQVAAAQAPTISSHPSSSSYPCNPLLFDCCPSATGIGPDSDDDAPSVLISPADVQALLLHTLRVHLGGVFPAHTQAQLHGWARTQGLLDVFRALRSLAHRDQSMSPMFAPSPAAAVAAATATGLPPQPSSSSSSSSSSAEKRRGSISARRASISNSGGIGGGGSSGGSGAVASQAAPIIIVTPSAARVADQSSTGAGSGSGQDEATISVITEESGISSPPSASPSPPSTTAPLSPPPSSPLAGRATSILPGGPYIEASMHPLFSVRSPRLFLYRKSHPMHVVLEIEVESRCPAPIVLDALAVVVQAQPQTSAGTGGSGAGTGTVGGRGEHRGNGSARPIGSPRSAPQRKQVSVIVTPASSPFRSASAAAAAGTASQGSEPAANGGAAAMSKLEVPSAQPVPSPLPSQSLSTSSSLDNLSSLRASGSSSSSNSSSDELVVPLSTSSAASASSEYSSASPMASPSPAPSPSQSPLPSSSIPDGPTPSPDPVSSFQTSSVHTVQLGAPMQHNSTAAAVSGPAEAAAQVPAATTATEREGSAEEWECVFERVTLQPGSNQLYLHVFHASPVPSTVAAESEASAAEAPASTATAAAAAESMATHASSTGGDSGGGPACHYSLVLYHSHTTLERIHALFEASHAHMVEIVEQRSQGGRRGSISGSGSAGAGGGGGSRRGSTVQFPPSLPSPSSHVHSLASTTLALRDVWFSFGRLQLWALDLESLNGALETHVLTRKQRRAQLAKLARLDAARMAAGAGADKQQGEFAEVDLDGPAADADAATVPPAAPVPSQPVTILVDPHTQSGFTPPTVSFRPFSGKPRLSIDLLPVAPAALLLGKRAPFQLAVQVDVGPATPASESGRPARIERCVLHVAAEGDLRLFAREETRSTGGGFGSGGSRGASRQNSDESDLAPSLGSAVVYGLLQHEGRSEQRSFALDHRTGDIALGTLPAGCKLLLLIPVQAPGHLSHLLRTRQIALPTASQIDTPQSRPASPGPAGSERRLAHRRRNDSSGGGNSSANQARGGLSRHASGDFGSTAPVHSHDSSDLHSVTHALSLDLTCAPGSGPTSGSDSGSGSDASGPGVASAPSSSLSPQASFMFSSYTSLTFMEPVQVQASMERLGQRWFLQLYLWNRCAFPLALREYKLHLPAGFVLKHDPNTHARGHVLPPLPAPPGSASGTDPLGATGALASELSLLPGTGAAALAASVPVSYSSPNVYSMVFELAVASPFQAEEAGSGSGVELLAAPQSRRPSVGLAPDWSGLPDEEAELAASYAWASMGRFALQVDSGPLPTSASNGSATASAGAAAAAAAAASASLPPSRALSLSWPIDIQIMSGAQDLHLVLSFPQAAYTGRLLTLTLTVLHMRGAKGKGKRARGGAKEREARGSIDGGVAATVTAAAAAAAAAGASTGAAPLSLLYSVRCAPHLWLLSGRQSHAFHLAEGEQRSFTLRLLPIASGYLPIPHVDLLEQRRNDEDGGSVLQRAADKLMHMQQRQRQPRAAADGCGGADAGAPSGSASASPPVSCGGVSYVGIPPARILRHFSPKHQIHVYPPHSFATQMLPM